MESAYIGIGANLGNAQDSVENAFHLLHALPRTHLVEQSALFRSMPVDADGEDYVNAVACISTGLSPIDLLTALLAIEQKHGRIRTYRNAPRLLDLDILLYGQLRVQMPDLVIPHPRLTQRAFALIPLLQIAPLIHIPGLGAAHTFVQGVADQRICKIAA